MPDVLIFLIGYLIFGSILCSFEILVYDRFILRRNNVSEYFANKRNGTLKKYRNLSVEKVVAGVIFWPLSTLIFIIYFCWKPFLRLLLYIPESVLLAVKLIAAGILDIINEIRKSFKGDDNNE